MELEEFLLNHLIVKIGNAPLDYLCTDAIVDDPEELVAIVERSNYFISSIQWWDRAKIECGSKIGYGGPRDPRIPTGYFFAETDIGKKFDAYTPSSEYYQYLNCVRDSYIDFELFPAFDIAAQKTQK